MPNFNYCYKNHRILEATFLASSFFDERPEAIEIDLLVIHCISLPPGVFGERNIHKMFLNQLDINEHPYYKTIPSTQVSSHLLIERDGSLTQFVPFDKRAWHAGVSKFKDQSDCNSYSIGIELEGTEDKLYTSSQYETLVACTALLMQVYPAIQPNRIVGHSDIAPERKTDPGPSFDWDYFKQKLLPRV